MSIKTNFEFPRGSDPLKQGGRLAQDLSSNFKSVNNELDKINKTLTNSLGTNYIDLTYVLNLSTSATISIIHNLGSIPKGWYIIDQTLSASQIVSVDRISWDSVQLSLRGHGSSGGTGTFLIRVFIKGELYGS